MSKRIIGVGTCCLLILLSTPFAILADIHEKNESNVLFHTTITILQPEEGMLYVWSRPLIPLPFNQTIIIGPIVIQAGVTGFNGFEVDFYIDGELKFHDNSWPFEYSWIDPGFWIYLITVELTGYGLKDSIKVIKII
jgi:hypothetical protein